MVGTIDIRIALQPIGTDGSKEPFAWHLGIHTRSQAFHTVDAILGAEDRIDLEGLRLDRALQAAAAARLGESGCLLVVPVNARAGAPARLLGHLFRAALRHRLPMDRVVVEVSVNESADHVAAAGLLQECAHRGLMVALADFAAGPVALRLLAHCSPRLLRLDPALAHRLEAAPARASIVKGVVRLARGMGVAVVAPVAELPEEREAARAAGLRHFHGTLDPSPRPRRRYTQPLRVWGLPNRPGTRANA